MTNIVFGRYKLTKEETMSLGRDNFGEEGRYYHSKHNTKRTRKTLYILYTLKPYAGEVKSCVGTY